MDEDFWLHKVLPIILQFGVPLGLILLGYVTGRIIERRHFRRIRRMEQQPGPMLTNLRRLPGAAEATGGWLCSGSVVIASDQFKTFGAKLKNLVGGRLRTLESLLDRARREALLRMRTEASGHGADVVMNVRLMTSIITRTSVEVVAYGTAVRLAEDRDGSALLRPAC